MSVPVIELDALLKSLEATIDLTFTELQRRYNQATADGATPNTAIQRLIDEIRLDQGTIVAASNRMASEISQSTRNVYHTLQQEWSSALGAAKTDPTKFHFLSKVGKNWVTSQQAGYTVSVDDLGKRIVNFSDGGDDEAIDAIENQIRQKRRIERLQREGQQPQIIQEGRESAETKHDVNLIWIAVFVNTCKDCLRLHGTMKTRLEWERGGIRPGSGHTVCRNNCQCHLVPAKTMGKRLYAEDPQIAERLSDSQIRNETIQRTERGIQIQKERIKEMAKKRGKQYSDSYEEQMLGQVQADRFNPYARTGARTNLYLRKIPKNQVTKKFIENVQVKK
jgi:hypothetical protein